MQTSSIYNNKAFNDWYRSLSKHEKSRYKSIHEPMRTDVMTHDFNEYMELQKTILVPIKGPGGRLPRENDEGPSMIIDEDINTVIEDRGNVIDNIDYDITDTEYHPEVIGEISFPYKRSAGKALIYGSAGLILGYIFGKDNVKSIVGKMSPSVANAILFILTSVSVDVLSYNEIIDLRDRLTRVMTVGGVGTGIGLLTGLSDRSINGAARTFIGLSTVAPTYDLVKEQIMREVF